MKIFLVFLAFFSSVLVKAQTTSDLWINEFHYDGMTSYGQADINEFVELIIKTPIAENPAELAKYTLVLYTAGALDNTPLTPGRGLPYNVASPLYTQAETVYPLSGFQSCPSGTAGFTILSKPMSIMQDIPTGMALVYNGTIVVQFLSYEKAFKTAPAPAGAPAAGITSMLIATVLGMPAVENALSQTNHSVALTGSGINYSNFTWDDNVIRTATPCAVNSGQTLQVPLPVSWLGFRASAVRNNILLQWQTGDETDNQRYDIELFKNSSFTKVAVVSKDLSLKGVYNSQLSQMSDGVYRIRIKSVGLDGRFNYSPEQVVKMGNRQNGVLVYPNPATVKNATLQIVPLQANGYTITVTDVAGRRLITQKPGALVTNQINLVPLKLQALKPGTYRVHINNIKENYTVGLMVVD